MSGWQPNETGMEEAEFICPATGEPCTADMQGWWCEDYGCARKMGLFREE